jgi:hypothetical protein
MIWSFRFPVSAVQEVTLKIGVKRSLEQPQLKYEQPRALREACHVRPGLGQAWAASDARIRFDHFIISLINIMLHVLMNYGCP